MKGILTAPEQSCALEQGLAEVRARMAGVADQTPLAHVASDMAGCLEGGKLLRARLVLRLAPDSGASPETAIRAATAVELVHAASLLHDDVIDGGRLRRAAPAFWVRHGLQAAILVGDLLLCEATRLLEGPGDDLLLRELVARTGEVCRAEVEQELVLRGKPADWETAVRLARQKTGALFAFSAVAACGVAPAGDSLRSVLREAGYRAGTAYQLSDDVLDVLGDSGHAGKTLGRDGERDKVTAGSARPADSAGIRRAVDVLRKDAEALLAPYPAADAAFRRYWSEDLGPILDRHLCPMPDPRVDSAMKACVEQESG